MKVYISLFLSISPSLSVSLSLYIYIYISAVLNFTHSRTNYLAATGGMMLMRDITNYENCVANFKVSELDL